MKHNGLLLFLFVFINVQSATVEMVKCNNGAEVMACNQTFIDRILDIHEQLIDKKWIEEYQLIEELERILKKKDLQHVNTLLQYLRNTCEVRLSKEKAEKLANKENHYKQVMERIASSGSLFPEDSDTLLDQNIMQDVVLKNDCVAVLSADDVLLPLQKKHVAFVKGDLDLKKPGTIIDDSDVRDGQLSIMHGGKELFLEQVAVQRDKKRFLLSQISAHNPAIFDQYEKVFSEQYAKQHGEALSEYRKKYLARLRLEEVMLYAVEDYILYQKKQKFLGLMRAFSIKLEFNKNENALGEDVVNKNMLSVVSRENGFNLSSLFCKDFVAYYAFWQTSGSQLDAAGNVSVQDLSIEKLDI